MASYKRGEEYAKPSSPGPKRFFVDLIRPVHDPEWLRQSSRAINYAKKESHKYEPRKTPRILYVKGLDLKNAPDSPESPVHGTQNTTEVIANLLERRVIVPQLALRGLRLVVVGIDKYPINSEDVRFRQYDIRVELEDIQEQLSGLGRRLVGYEMQRTRQAIGLDVGREEPPDSPTLFASLGTLTVERARTAVGIDFIQLQQHHGPKVLVGPVGPSSSES